MTGLHTVRDVFCASCSSLLVGSTILRTSRAKSTRKFIVEKAMVLHEGGW